MQFGKYDVTIVGKSQKRNMSHDLIQYINSSILVVNEYDDENFNRVLLPVQNFPGSMKAAKYAIRVAMSYDVGIDILNVLDENKSKNEDSSNVSKIIKLIRRSGVDHKYIKEDGDPVEKIIEKSNNDKIIVMRASNMSPIKRYFRGSKPLSVMKSCNVPILIVK